MSKKRMGTDKNGGNGERFTPGPWTVTFFEYSIGNIKQRKFTVCGGGHAVAGCNSYNPDFYEENDKNGYIIAAAPEMYEALKGLIDIFPSLNIEVDKTVLERTPVWRKLCHILCSADEALKKARGEE